MLNLTLPIDAAPDAAFIAALLADHDDSADLIGYWEDDHDDD